MANRLAGEQSPYLKQHACNPVDWYPWGKEAFDKAIAENKPVLVSIGYAACHWCHVMERESFENEQVATFMNAQFVCIKVDREEHPDVDHFYMDAVQAMTGSGGWPLNVFTTPERLPFYGGTYFPPKPAYNRPSWIELLYRIAEIWKDQPSQVALQTEQMQQHLKQAARSGIINNNKKADLTYCRLVADNLLKQADTVKGGFGIAPKFPGTMAITYLLEHYLFTGYAPALKHALLSLDCMANGGIYDQLTGGFARYATDNDWLVPHFEKMLYDNALLVSVYCDAYRITGNLNYKKIIEEVVQFVETELKDETGVYYCAIDADSEGVEGKYYTWDWEELKMVLDADFDIIITYYGIKEGGNWDGTNILHKPILIQEIASQFGLTVEALEIIIERARKSLIEIREKRIRPITDDKSLLSWNALINWSLTKVGITLNEPGYIERAGEHLQWLWDNFRINNELFHAWKEGVARIPAKLDDYAYFIQAMMQIGTSTRTNKWLVRAAELIEQVQQHFTTPTRDFFYYSAENQQDIPIRKIELYDGATPSANAVMAGNLIFAGMYMEKWEWLEQGFTMLNKMQDTVARFPNSYGYWALYLHRQAIGMKTVVCAGKHAETMQEEILKKYYPHIILITSKKEISVLPILEKKYFVENNSIFVCEEQNCLLPVNNAGEAMKIIEENWKGLK